MEPAVPRWDFPPRSPYSPELHGLVITCLEPDPKKRMSVFELTERVAVTYGEKMADELTAVTGDEALGAFGEGAYGSVGGHGAADTPEEPRGGRGSADSFEREMWRAGEVHQNVRRLSQDGPSMGTVEEVGSPSRRNTSAFGVDSWAADFADFGSATEGDLLGFNPAKPDATPPAHTVHEHDGGTDDLLGGAELGDDSGGAFWASFGGVGGEASLGAGSEPNSAGRPASSASTAQHALGDIDAASSGGSFGEVLGGETGGGEATGSFWAQFGDAAASSTPSHAPPEKAVAPRPPSPPSPVLAAAPATSSSAQSDLMDDLMGLGASVNGAAGAAGGGMDDLMGLAGISAPSSSDSAAAQVLSQPAADRPAAEATHAMGQTVVVCGLQSKPHLNGSRGTILGWDGSKCRYNVSITLANGASSVMALKPANVSLPPAPSANMPLDPLCGPAHPAGGSVQSPLSHSGAGGALPDSLPDGPFAALRDLSPPQPQPSSLPPSKPPPVSMAETPASDMFDLVGPFEALGTEPPPPSSALPPPGAAPQTPTAPAAGNSPPLGEGGGDVSSATGSSGAAAGGAPSNAASGGAGGLRVHLKELRACLDDGLITEEEFEREKATLLQAMRPV